MMMIGAIPETTEYANGWNDCRKECAARVAELEQKVAGITWKRAAD